MFQEAQQLNVTAMPRDSYTEGHSGLGTVQCPSRLDLGNSGKRLRHPRAWLVGEASGGSFRGKTPHLPELERNSASFKIVAGLVVQRI
jgi:hypothetical protein